VNALPPKPSHDKDRRTQPKKTAPNQEKKQNKDVKKKKK
jgi:hypothetical protein